MARREFEEDDGRTIADMSDVAQPSLWGRSPAPERGADRSPERKASPYPDAPFTPGEKRLFVTAALKAALLIGLAFIVGLGLVIAALLGIWSLL